MGASEGTLKLSSYTPASSDESDGAGRLLPSKTNGLSGSSLADATDFDLLMLLRNGNQSAGSTLVNRYCPMLMKYLERLTGSSLIAEELHQQTWLSAIEYADRFKVRLADTNRKEGDEDGQNNVTSFKAWLFRIATNKVNDHWRAAGRTRKAKAGLSLVIETEHPASDHRMEASEQENKLKAAIALLPENQREVVVLRYYSNLKFTEIAQVVGCPLNTALGRMHKAIQKLKELMESTTPKVQ